MTRSSEVSPDEEHIPTCLAAGRRVEQLIRQKGGVRGCGIVIQVGCALGRRPMADV